MHIFSTVSEIKRYLSNQKKTFSKVGFVPTMGALHQGHLLLVQKAKEENQLTVVSIFVNPTQFNNKEDLEKYPRTMENDLQLLNSVGCDVVFAPTVEEIYPPNFENIHLDLDPIDKVMEGKHRPGHFQGVVNVVKRLFDIVLPSKAYFGKKDFQQVAVIQEMTAQLKLPVEIVPVATLRESSGLALSSRNMRLNKSELAQATVIYQALMHAKSAVGSCTPNQLEQDIAEKIHAAGLEVEYVEIVHPQTLQRLNDTWEPGATACVVAYCGSVRLIDNMELIPVRIN